MLKKLICVFLGVILCLGLVVSVSASGTTYYVDEGALKITLPYGMTVFTRGMKADDPSFASLGITKSQVEEMLKAGYAYLDAVSYDNTYEVLVNVQEAKEVLSDFSKMSDSEISSFGSGLIEGMKAMGSEQIDIEIYQHKQTKFTKIYTRRLISNNYIYTLTYTTIIGGKCISVIFSSLKGTITNVLDFTANEIVDSVQFNEITNTPSSSSSIDSSKEIVYADKETNTTFSVPVGWSKQPLSQTRQYIDVKYVNDKDSTAIIMYGSTDLWAQLTTSEKAGCSREDVDGDFFTASELAAVMGLEADQITSVKFNDVSYFKFTSKFSGELLGVQINLNMTMLIYLKNGFVYYYAFQYSGEDESQYSDFEKMMRSVKYAQTSVISSSTASSKKTNAVSITSVTSKATVSSTVSKATSSVSSKPVAAQPNQTGSGSSVWAVLVTILVFATPILIYRYAIKKKRVDNALLITIFYGLGAAAVTALLAVFFDVGFICVGVVALWSIINYLILTAGKKETATMIQVNEQRQDLYCQDTIKPEQKPIEEEPETTENSIEPMKEQNNSMVAPHPNFCENCGEKLRPESKFCPKCGEKVEELGD